MNYPKILAIAFFLTFAFIMFLNGVSRAAEVGCPPGVTSCKIISVTNDEERALTGPGAIFDLAEFANRMNLTGPVQYWKNKLAAAPEVKVEAKPKATGPSETSTKKPEKK